MAAVGRSASFARSASVMESLPQRCVRAVGRSRPRRRPSLWLGRRRRVSGRQPGWLRSNCEPADQPRCRTSCPRPGAPPQGRARGCDRRDTALLSEAATSSQPLGWVGGRGGSAQCRRATGGAGVLRSGGRPTVESPGPGCAWFRGVPAGRRRPVVLPVDSQPSDAAAGAGPPRPLPLHAGASPAHVTCEIDRHIVVSADDCPGLNAGTSRGYPPWTRWPLHHPVR